MTPSHNPSSHFEEPSLHDQRLDHAVAALKATGARRVLDLGCGSGMLLHRLLAEPQFEQVVGVETSATCLAHARFALQAYLDSDQPKLKLLRASYAVMEEALTGYDAAAMVETIEHVDPGALSTVERAVFGQYRPASIFMTTPNRDYNPLLGLAPGEFREADHKFEWCRARFRRWASDVARRNRYRVRFGGIGDFHPDHGQPTQTALFIREDDLELTHSAEFGTRAP